MSGVITTSNNNQAAVDYQQDQQQQQSNKVLQSTKSPNEQSVGSNNNKTSGNKDNTDNKISEVKENSENFNSCENNESYVRVVANENGSVDSGKSSVSVSISTSTSTSTSTSNSNSNSNSNSALDSSSNSSSSSNANGNASKKLCVVLPPPPPSQKTLVTPTIVANETCATPTQLFTSLIQLNGQDVGLFTGLPSCTPTSADSLSASNLGGINPFFWGVSSSFNQDANNNINSSNNCNINLGATSEIRNSDPLNQQANKQADYETTLSIGNGTTKHNNNNHQLSKLSLDRIQAANAILSPLSLFLSPEGLRFVDSNQHPLAGISGLTNHELPTFNNLGSLQTVELANNYGNATTTTTSSTNQPTATTTTNGYNVAAQDLTSIGTAEGQQQQHQVVNCPVLSLAGSVHQARSTITASQPYNLQQQQQSQQTNQISQSIYNQNHQHLHHHQLDKQNAVQQAQIAATTNPHQLSPKALSHHHQLLYHHQHSTPGVDNHLHHIVQQQQQNVIYGQNPPVVPLAQCKTLDRQKDVGPPAAHHHHQIRGIHQEQHHHHHHQQQQLLVNSQQVFPNAEQQTVPRLIEFHQHHHSQQDTRDRARQTASSFPYDQASPTTIGIYDPHIRNIYLAQQQQQQQQNQNQHPQQSFNHQGYQVQPTTGCTQQNQRVQLVAVSPTAPESSEGNVAKLTDQIVDDPSTAPKQTAPILNGKHKDKVGSSTHIKADSDEAKITDKSSKCPQNEQTQIKAKQRPNKTKSSPSTAAATTTTTTTTANDNEVINNGEEIVVKKKSKGGRKKKIITHDELLARKSRSKERNRVAAKRCRLKRKQFLDELCGRIDNLNDLNKRLQKENNLLRGELDILKQHHITCEI